MTPDLIARAAGLYGRSPATPVMDFGIAALRSSARECVRVVEGTAGARLLRVLAERKGRAATSIAGIGEMLPEIPRETLRSAVSRLVRDGLLDASGRNHRRRVYALTDAGLAAVSGPAGAAGRTGG